MSRSGCLQTGHRLAFLSLLLVALALTRGGRSPVVHAQQRLQLWFYAQTNLQASGEVARINGLIDRAAAAGYTGLVLADTKLELPASLNGTFYNLFLQQVLAHAKQKGVAIVPQILSFGHSNSIIDFDKNLAEPQPIVGTPLTVASDGRTLLVSSTVSGPSDGGFEAHNGNVFTQWAYQDPTSRIVADTTTVHGGRTSMRIDGGSGAARISSRQVAVQAWRQYHVRFWARTRSLSGRLDLRVMDATSRQDRHYYPSEGVEYQPTQTWTQYDFVFNSADSNAVVFWMGFWAGQGPTSSSGSLWLDDVSVDETALVNLVRRDGAPLRIHDASGNEYLEGRDVDPVSDPDSIAYGSFTDWHTPPAITIPTGSRLAPGRRVLMDWYGVTPISGRQTGACLTAAGVQAYMTSSIQALSVRVPEGTGFVMNYDELRHVNTCASCAARGLTAGQLLAWHVAQGVATVRSVRPGAPLYVWNDMFDPYQNAVDNYYFAGGTLADSRAGLPTDVVVMNWNLNHLSQSLGYFADLGYTQFITGYYDSQDGAASATRELAAAKGIAGLQGMMYTTWVADYSQLENYATTARALSGR